MTQSIQPGMQAASRLPPAIQRYVGEVVYIYAFDVAYEMSRQPVKELLGQPAEQFSIDAGKRSPRQLFFYRAQMVRLPSIERTGPFGLMRVERSIKLLPVGAISITVRVPFDVERLEDLVAFHDLRFEAGSLHDEVRQLADDVHRELRSYYIRPTDRPSDEEAYTVFCINTPASMMNGQSASTEQWLAKHRREVASLLTQEAEIEHLSEQETAESTARYLSYYDHDLVVVDWDAALVMDEPRHFDEVLYIMELANVQLAELEAYDRLLDETVERAYRDATGARSRNRYQVMRQLSEMRIDMARLSDELSNITKFFGDWHLARLYQALAVRFHLADWHQTIEQKLKTLGNIYDVLKHDQATRWMLVLEAMIVLLFIVDLAVLFFGRH